MIKLPAAGTVEIAPSILSADFARLGGHVAEITNEVKFLHVDVMDGHFVPNITIGPVVVKSLRKVSGLFFDVHLMISDAPKYAPEFVKAGADGITFHLEAVPDSKEMINQLRKLGCSVGVSIKPGTPVAELKPIIQLVDMVLLMTVEPGFGGQSFIPESIARCQELRQMLRPNQRLEVDGGIDPTTAPRIVAAGADTLVAGSAVFAKPDPAAAVKAILAACK